MGRGAWAVLDQGLFAGAGFVVNILLARWLPPEQYGAFALGFFVFLLAGAAHTSLLTEPMLIYGASRYAHGFRRYLALLLVGHTAVTALAALAVGLTALIFQLTGNESAAGAFAGLAVAIPMLLLLWLVRRAFYVFLRPQWSACGDALYLVAMVAGVWTLHRADRLSPGLVFVVMGISGLAAALCLIGLLRPDFRGNGGPLGGEVFSDHRRYGSWNVLAQAVYWSSGQILVVLIPLVLGLQALAALAAVLNLFRPLYPLLQSAGALYLPAASSRAESSEGLARVNADLKRLVLIWGGAVLGYGLLVTALAGPILHHLYGGRYDGFARIAFFLALTTAASAIVQLSTLSLKATGRVRLVPLVWGISAVVTAVFSIPVMILAGLNGALALSATSYITAAFVAWRIARAGRIPSPRLASPVPRWPSRAA